MVCMDVNISANERIDKLYDQRNLREGWQVLVSGFSLNGEEDKFSLGV